LGHPEIQNSTPFAFEPVFIADEELRPAIVTVVKGTFGFGLEGDLWVAAKQVPVNLAGEPSTDAAVSSYKFEPETALWKAATDVVLIGHAQPPSGSATQVDVGIKVGTVQKLARVFGDRYWIMSDNTVLMTRAEPMGRVPLTWENAFGGRDDPNSTPERPVMDPRNPVGTGFGGPVRQNGDRLKLPNIEDPSQLINEYGAVVPPCGFGFTSPNWEPRARFAGTYDETWSKTRKPMLPIDFDRRFFSAAAPGLIAQGYLRGDEEVVLLNVTAVPRLALRLPAVSPPQCRVTLRGRRDVHLQTSLDTLVVDADTGQLTLLWRAYTLLSNGPHDVTAIAVESN
jgi:hypothetical protein